MYSEYDSVDLDVFADDIEESTMGMTDEEFADWLNSHSDEVSTADKWLSLVEEHGLDNVVFDL